MRYSHQASAATEFNFGEAARTEAHYHSLRGFEDVSESLHRRVPAYDRYMLAPVIVVPLRPHDPALMRAYEVSRAVNSVKNDTPECVEPLGQPRRSQSAS